MNTLLPEAQPNQKIFLSYEEFLNSIYLDNWIILYIFLELSLIRDFGYDPNLNEFKNNGNSFDDIKKIKIDNFIYDVPEYLITKKIPKNLSNNFIKKSLYFTRNIIQNRFFYLIG